MKTYLHARRRLSYANVMATLAFFFALSGASVAGIKYIANGDPAGGDLTGTFPDPMIAAGKVTSDKFAPTAKAPDADRVDGLDSTAFLSVTGKAADADKLDGLDSTAFLQTAGSTIGGLGDVVISNIPADLGSLTLSPGKSYALFATAQLSNLDPTQSAPVVCAFVSGDPGENYGVQLEAATVGSASTQTITLSGVASGHAGPTVTFSCYVNTTYVTTVRARHARLTAITLDSLTTN